MDKNFRHSIGYSSPSLSDLLKSPVSLPDYESVFSRTGRRIVYNILRRINAKECATGKPIVTLSGGLPDTNTVPAIQAKFFLRDGNVIELDKKDMAAVGNYGQAEGLPELREWLTELHRVEHEPPQLIRTDHPEPFILTITNGITDGLRGVFHVLLDEDDHVLIEDEVYSNTISALTLFGAKPVTVTSDEGGMLAQDLEDVLASWATTHPNTKRPRVLYSITACNNPKSYTMEQERLIDIYKVCRKYDVIILEDAAYYFMQFQQRRRGFQSIDVDGRVLRFDTFSKIIGAGYRLGWLSGPETLVRKYINSLSHNTIHPCILSQVTTNLLSLPQIVISKILHQWGFETFYSEMRKLAAAYEKKAQNMEGILKKYLSAGDDEHDVDDGYDNGDADDSGVRIRNGHHPLHSFDPCSNIPGVATWNFPSGGMFFWVRIKGVSDTSQLMEEALAEGVAIVAGRLFSPDQAPKPFIRLSFSVAGVEEMDSGIKTLSEIVKKIQRKI
ncbi:kynurenine/alpha-aminoadipate aminotransferase, mitochondrial-like [Physella acuta]|uniref:kynurenine/alpha-aminoadipate aminotransferase, mitochondrial-like n=1 Tax=Physella acuta TaxID=109671 RepID=UPI0027DB2853|nr:kynurenine/alpha-aminoadipate aminotransferase, mitochondrial-like [Physella acuta]